MILRCLRAKKNLEVMKKSVPLQSQMKNGWLTRPRVLDKTDALEIKIEKFFQKSLEIKK